MNTAFNALSDWRNELAGVMERNSATAFDKMAVAAKSMGWHPEFVDLTRKQLQQATSNTRYVYNHFHQHLTNYDILHQKYRI